MLGRAGCLVRLHTLIRRQLSATTNLSQIHKSENLPDDKQVTDAAPAVLADSAINEKKKEQKKINTNYRNKNQNQFQRQDTRPQRKQQQQSPNINKYSSFTKKNYSFAKDKEEATEINPKTREVYKEAVLALESSLKLSPFSHSNLVEACQKLISIYDVDDKAVEMFKTDPIKRNVVQTILKNFEKMTIDEFLSSAHFVFRFSPKSIDQIQIEINKRLPQLSIGHLLKLVSLTRSVAWASPESSAISNLVREVTDMARTRIDEIDSVEDAKRALRLFTQESTIVQRIDMRFSSQLAEKLSLADWIELLSVKSKLKQRNLNTLELCTYNIAKLLGGSNKNTAATNEEEPNTATSSSSSNSLTLEQIQNCLLACGVLHYRETTFFELVVAQLREVLKAVPSSVTESTAWINQNESYLKTIIASLGMLQLRDDSLMNTLCALLKVHRDRVKLIVGYVQTCGALNYAPSSTDGSAARDFAQIVAAVDAAAAFDGYLGNEPNHSRQRAHFLNYVWSLCAVNRADQYLVASALDKRVFDAVLKEKETKDFKPNLLKILNINMHSIFRMENYEGPNLPEDFNLEEYSEILAPKHYSSANEILVSTLAGFRSIEKYVKVNLLTPFGILIDAFMVVDKRGTPLPLDKFLNKDSPAELGQDDMRVAFKLVGYKDQTLINKKINGIVMFQLNLLQEVGYYPLLVYEEELQATSLVDRVALIEKRLRELSHKK